MLILTNPAPSPLILFPNLYGKAVLLFVKTILPGLPLKIGNPRQKPSIGCLGNVISTSCPLLLNL